MKYMRIGAALLVACVSGALIAATGHVKLTNSSSHDLSWGLWSKEGKNFDKKNLPAGQTQLEGNDAGGKLKNMQITMTYPEVDAKGAETGKTVTKYIDYYFPQDLEGFWAVVIDGQNDIYMSSTKSDNTDVEIRLPQPTGWTTTSTK